MTAQTMDAAMAEIAEDIARDGIGKHLLGMLSDLQELVETGNKEEALRAINRMKVYVDKKLPKQTFGAADVSARNKVKALRERMEQATEGPWKQVPGRPRVMSGTDDVLLGQGTSKRALANAVFAAEAQRAMPYLMRSVALVEYMVGQQDALPLIHRNPYFVEAAKKMLIGLRNS